MISGVDDRGLAVLRRAAVRATLAPSTHNAQPWRFHLHPGVLDVHLDGAQRLPVPDPNGRQVTISCGCALLNARVSIAAADCGVRIERCPDPSEPALLARISTINSGDAPNRDLAALDVQIAQRHTNHHALEATELPPDLVDMIGRAASAEGCELAVITRPEDKHAVATWSDDARNERARGGTLILIGTPGDRRLDWLHTGEALQRILLELTTYGFVADAMTDLVVHEPRRAQLTDQLGLAVLPHILLRVGRAPATPASRRRRLMDVLFEDA